MKWCLWLNTSRLTSSYDSQESITEVLSARTDYHSSKDIDTNSKDVSKKLGRVGANTLVMQLENERTILDPLQLMILLFLSENKHIPTVFQRYCRLNINLSLTDSNRQEVEFYIPQLTNYIVFHEEFNNSELIDTMEAAYRCDFYFAHKYYLYLNSLEKSFDQEELQVTEPIKKYKLQLLTKLSQHYSDWMLYNQSLDCSIYNEKATLHEVIRQFRTAKQMKSYLFVEIQDIKISFYPSFYYPDSNNPPSSFKNTINFFQDLFAISSQMNVMKGVVPDSKKANLKLLLQKINGFLPALTYLVCKKQIREYLEFIRHCNILNILEDETLMLNTKEKFLLSVSLEIYNPTEIIDEKER